MIEDLMGRVREATGELDARISEVVAPLLEEREKLAGLRVVVHEATKDIDAGIARIDAFLSSAGHRPAKKPSAARRKPQGANGPSRLDYEVARTVAGFQEPVTSLEVGEALGIARGTAGERLRSARKHELIREAGGRPPAGGSGQPARLYAALPDTMARVEEAMSSVRA